MISRDSRKFGQKYHMKPLNSMKSVKWMVRARSCAVFRVMVFSLSFKNKKDNKASINIYINTSSIKIGFLDLKLH